MSQQLEVTVNLTDDRVRFTGKAGENPEIICDYYPPIGTGKGYTGLELLMVSLAACSGTAVVSILRKMGKIISEFKVRARGIRREEHPMSLEKIFLEFFLTSENTSDEELEKVIGLSEETYCPVWAMLKGSCEITAQYKILGAVKK